MFFDGKGKIPEDYQYALVCEKLKLSYTELEKQPAWWVDSMLEYLKHKDTYQDAQQKLEKQRAKTKKRPR